MRRAPGWITLAGIGLELAVLACAVRVMEEPAPPKARRDATPAVLLADDDIVARSAPHNETAPSVPEVPPPIEFLTDGADPQAKYYRASDDTGIEVYAALLSDGRVRLADTSEHRLAGMVEGGHADLLDVANNGWSELFLRVTPSGRMQFEMRGGPYDAHVLTCEPISDDKV